MTIEEKTFIASNHPEIEVKSITLQTTCFCSDDDYPVENMFERIAFFNEGSRKEYDDYKGANGADVSFVLVDHGVNLNPKKMTFKGPVDINYKFKEEGRQIRLDILPTCSFVDHANNKGEFRIEIPIAIGNLPDDEIEEYEDGGEDIVDYLISKKAIVEFYNVEFSNQFVTQRFDFIKARMSKGNEKPDIYARAKEYTIVD